MKTLLTVLLLVTAAAPAFAFARVPAHYETRICEGVIKHDQHANSDWYMIGDCNFDSKKEGKAIFDTCGVGNACRATVFGVWAVDYYVKKVIVVHKVVQDHPTHDQRNERKVKMFWKFFWPTAVVVAAVTLAAPFAQAGEYHFACRPNPLPSVKADTDPVVQINVGLKEDPNDKDWFNMNVMHVHYSGKGSDRSLQYGKIELKKESVEQAPKLADEGHNWLIRIYRWFGTNNTAPNMYIVGQLYVAVDADKNGNATNNVVTYEEWAKKFNDKKYEQKLTSATCEWRE